MEFLVVGAGVAGVAIATGLRALGREVLLVERDASPALRFRGEYLQPSAVAVLSALGLDSVLDGASVPISSLHFRDMETPHGTPRAETWIRYPEGQARAIPHHALVGRLQAIAAERLGADFVRGVSLDTIRSGRDFCASPMVHIEASGSFDRWIRPRWVIACDGRDSKIRGWVGGPPCPPNGPVTVGARTELIVGGLGRSRLARTDVVEVVRTPHDGTLWLFALTPDTVRLYWNVAAGKDLKKTELHRRLGAVVQTAEAVIGPVTDRIEEVAAAPAMSGWLGPASSGRVVFAGDSVAVTTPLGGQGMTCATRHAALLLAEVERRRGKAHALDLPGVLRYDAGVRRHHREIALLNFGIYHLFYAPGRLRAPTRHVLASWAHDAGALSRIGQLFGGSAEHPLKVGEVPHLWGLASLPGWRGHLRTALA